MIKHLNHHTFKNKWLSLLLLLLTFTQVSWAQTDEWSDHKASGYASGQGTKDEPYIIKTAAQLAYFASQVTAGNDLSVNVELQANINLAAHYWTAIGNPAGVKPNNSFAGVFEGNGFTISNMKQSFASKENTGFFANLKGNSVVRNLNFVGADIECPTQWNNTRRVGVLAGATFGNPTIENISIRNSKIHADGNFNQTQYFLIGGLLGGSFDKTTIKNCYVDVDIDLSKVTISSYDRTWLAQVVGAEDNNGSGTFLTMKNVYSIGTLKVGIDKTYNHLGNLVGSNPEKASYTNCFYQNVPTGKDGTSLTLDEKHNQGEQKSNYTSEFVKLVNEDSKSDDNLLSWESNGKVYTKARVIKQSHDDHTSKQIKMEVNYLDSSQDNADYTYEWTITSKPARTITGSGKSVMIDSYYQNITGSVKVMNGTTLIEELPFTINPLQYSVDLYADSFYSSGNGTKDNPYIIDNDMQLAKFAHDVTNAFPDKGNANLGVYNGVYFKLGKDIDLSSALWMPIGTWANYNTRYFSGKFDGDGHTIRNTRIVWKGKSGSYWSMWGLFSRLQGTASNEAGFCSVSNFILDGISVEKEAGTTLVGEGHNIGTIAGEISQNTEVSNIIVKNAKITDNKETYTTSYQLRLGGLVGNLDQSGVYRIYNLSADTEMDLLKNATQGKSKTIKIAKGFGQFPLSNSINNAYHIYPTNIYVLGPPITVSGRYLYRGTVVGEAPSYPKDDQLATWYYEQGIPTTNMTTRDLNIGSQKVPADFGSTFAQQNNKFLDDKDFTDKYFWVYTKDGFSFGKTTIKIDRQADDILTAETQKGNASNEKYYWYTSTDKKTWTKVSEEASNPLTLPRQEYDQYVYAVLADGSSCSRYEKVAALRITASLKTDSIPATYVIKLTNNIWDNNDNFTITYSWVRNGEEVSTEPTYKPGTVAESDRIGCHVIVKDKNGNIVLDKWVYKTTVVYLKPTGDITLETDKINDKEWGYSPTKPMSTWKGAYSKLVKNASWDENVIVLMGTSNNEVTQGFKDKATAEEKEKCTGFNLTSNYQGLDKAVSLNEWNKLTQDSPLKCSATITGKWDDKDYQGVIACYGDSWGLPIWGDTRFQNITFQYLTSSYDIIYCQYNNLEMGEGVKMSGQPASPGYGTIEGANTVSLQIFGGLKNDGRFNYRNDGNESQAGPQLMAEMKNYIPHGREGFSITLKSGWYSCVCVGGRHTGGTFNGTMGLPKMPIKCTIDIDIDQEFNNKNIPNAGYTPNYDVGIVLAGNHEGAMFADADLIIRSGRVGRVVNGTLGNKRDINFYYNGKPYTYPNNSYMGRANILIDPANSIYASKGDTKEQTNNRVIVTELYGGGTGRGYNGAQTIDNPFYGISTITINGGTFKILPESNAQAANIFSGIYGAGAGGMNGIGEKNNHTSDVRIPYWSADSVMLFGSYDEAKDHLITYHCYNPDTHTFTEVNPLNTNTRIVINGGVFGSEKQPIDGIYAGGSGYMSVGLWTDQAATPNTSGGNVYGLNGETVSSLTINDGTFYCKNGIFAGGRGTDYYYSNKAYGGNDNAKAYTDLGKTYGNVELNINGGTFYCPVFGGGYGVADATLTTDKTHTETLKNMARIYGKSTVNIYGGTFYKNIYGGGDMAVIDYNGKDNATNLTIGNNATIYGSVFGGGNGRDNTISPDSVGKVIGNTSLAFVGDIKQAPTVYGNIYGGGNLALVTGNTNVNLYAASFAGQIFGGGNGKLYENGTVKSYANVLGNTNVSLAKDLNEQNDQDEENAFSINVIWDRLWREEQKQVLYYSNNQELFYKNGKYLNPHNIYGGGNLACKVGTYITENGVSKLKENTGKATVTVLKGMTPFSLLKTQEWKESYTDNDNPHFYVFGGGNGKNTSVGSTDVTIDVEGEYGEYNAEVGDDTDQLARPRDSKKAKRNKANAAAKANTDIPVFDNSKGIPNFTILGVLGGGYAGTVTGNTKVVVDGQTFLHRVYGGGFGDPAATSATDATGQVGGNTEVYVQGANIYGDVFGGGAGVTPTNATSNPFSNIARVIGTTQVNVSDDAKIYGTVYGGGDKANVGPETYNADFTKKPTSETPINQKDGSIDNTKSYIPNNYRTLVNITGGDIFGEVYGGGKGVKKAKVNQYDQVGRINGNTLVHVANTYAQSFTPTSIDYAGNDVPYIWNRIYGGCAYGTVDGNTLVHIEGGMLGLNIFGGGYGDVPIDEDKTNEGSGQSTDMSILKQVLGKKDTKNKGTYANVLGNTKVQIDGGSWIWNKKADTNGNITSWLASGANSEKVCDDLDDFKKVAYAIKNAKTFDDIAYPKAKAALNRIMNDNDTKEFFSLNKATFWEGSFKKNHNIFGGGNRACYVGTYTDANGNAINADGKPMANTGGSTVEINHSPLGTLYDEKGNGSDIFDCTSLQGLCWYLGSRNTSHPQFSVFGAGYGANTKVGDAIVLAQPGAMIQNTGEECELDGKKYRYVAQQQDRMEYVKYETNLYQDFQKLSAEEKKLYYGSSERSDEDPHTFNRYYMSRMAWTLGIPSFTFMEIHGGGFSGYVMGDSYVEANNQMAAHNIYGAGLGATPYGTLSDDDNKNYDFGTVYGNSKVFVKSGNVSDNVYGGGAGVESVRVNDGKIIDLNAKSGKLVDFPEMARVKGKTQVHVYGETVSSSAFQLARTVIVGNVYGGGDVANVGEYKVKADSLQQNAYLDSKNYTSLVNVRGGTILSDVFAGGKGRTAAECADYTKLGGVYGNAFLITDRPVMNYPYCEKVSGTSDALSSRSLEPSAKEYLAHPADEVNKDIAPNIAGRIYGGCQNGTIYGNTFVAIQDGHLYHNVFGGGWGNYTTTLVNNEEVADSTAANVTGNTNLFVSGGRMMLSSYWLPDTRFWEPATVVGSNTYSPQYNPATRKFKINHNIYGGGNESCIVGERDENGKLVKGSGNTYLTIKKGLLYEDTQVLSGTKSENFFATNEWKEVYNKVGSPHFCIFGGGFGEHTNILGDTYLDVEMAERGLKHDPSFNIVKGEEHKHFIGGYSVMDLIGGGYSGKVEGTTHIVGEGGGFCRRVFGGGFYNSVKATIVNLKAIDCHDIFGGGLMGDVLKNTSITIGQKSNGTGQAATGGTSTGTSSTFDNSNIFVHGSVYGGNDVSGYVNVTLDPNGYFADNDGNGTKITIYGGQFDGDVYGAGNGDYLYALDKKGHTKVTVNENYPLNPDDPKSETEPLVYTVPMRETMPSYKAASDAAKIVNINSWRPMTNKVSIDIEGQADNDMVKINGAVYGGGNSATVQKVQKTQKGSSAAQALATEGSININIGSNVNIGQVFMGCNGDALFTASEDNDFMNKFQKLNGDIHDYTKELNLADSIDWISDPSNKGIITLYLSTENAQRPLVYPHLLDLYFQPVETDIQGNLTWNGNDKGTGLTNCTIGTFCCGGNRGNMNVYPDTEGKAFNYTFPAGLTITEKIIGGCNNANYEYKGKVSHEGGYLLGNVHSGSPFIVLNILNQFEPKQTDAKDAYIGGNVYGGCYKAGTVRGDITINLKSDMLNGKDKDKLEKSNELIATNPEYSSLNVYGAGYGMDSYVYGNTKIEMGEGSANFIYGGGQQGNVIGVTNVDILNGHVFRSVTGGSYSGYVWGSTQVKVGYPIYYKVKESGCYLLKRADQNNIDIDKKLTLAEGQKLASTTIKDSIYLIKDDIISQAVYDEIIKKWDSESKQETAINASNKGTYFEKQESPALSDDDWKKINIKIGEAVYGGGYSLAQGSSVMANNTTVLKYTPQYNLGANTVGFGGNTTILVADRTTAPSTSTGTGTGTSSTESEDRDHITISHQEMKQANVADGQDLLGYYYKGKDGEYHYIYQAGKYYKGTSYPEEISTDDKNIYQYDNEGGIFGDGHLSYAQGFRSADLTGYGFAGSNVNSPKILNTFQRLDILRLTDNCFSLLGVRDYATNATDKTPYSISRVGEIQMVADKVTEDVSGNLVDTKNNSGNDKGTVAARARNYMGLANNIHYVGALTSNVAFTDDWHDGKGQKGNYEGKTSYLDIKQQYIDDYYNGAKNDPATFEKRNDGTAKNMIGIASGYSLKVQNIQEFADQDGNITGEKLFYGPIYGVIEMNLIDVREDEGGGYVYADNVHKRPAADGKEHKVDFLETSGNFVFPYTMTQGRYIVDDCFPRGYDLLQSNETPDKDIDAHYWYVTGFNYHYTAHITGYTYDNATSGALPFYSNNEDGILSLSGLKKDQEVNVLSWKMYSEHQGQETDKTKSDYYKCDLEERNYSDLAEDKDVKGKYALSVAANDEDKYSDNGFVANLVMEKDKTSAVVEEGKAQIPAANAKLFFRLTDQANNATTEYYNQHLAQPCRGTLVLSAPAQSEDGKAITGKVALTKVYTKEGDKYTLVNSGTTLQSGITYYYKNGETDLYTAFTTSDKFYTRNDNGVYSDANSGNIVIGGLTPYYCEIPRYYTYTIDLTIEYIQGPNISGNITIENCALPGEMIRLKKNKVTVNADQAFSVNGYYWRIGKVKMDKDGKLTFEAVSTWSKNDTTTVYHDQANKDFPIYSTYKQGEKLKNGLFAGCNYEQTEDYLDIPAYYFMNGYGVQLGVTMNMQNTDIFPVEMLTSDTLVVHNYQRMDPNSQGVNLHLPEAIARAKSAKESQASTSSETVKDVFAAPRIYISNQTDFNTFLKFLQDDKGYGANAEFVILNDLDIPKDYTGSNAIFAGIMHGNGHVIRGLAKDNSLIGENRGQVYNLGLESGSIASKGCTSAEGSTEKGAYHCCFEYAPAVSETGVALSDANRTPIVYRMNGKAVTNYTKEDFLYGRVTYDLNEYYLRARYGHDILNNKEDMAALKYLYDYYANGDYQYSRRKDEILGVTTGYTYLRTGQNTDLPNYGKAETRHDRNHTIDKARAQDYQAAVTDANGKVTTPESRTGDYLPLFDENMENKEGQTQNAPLMNDYIFWGQLLHQTNSPENYPQVLTSQQLNCMTNRVYRTAGYYGDTKLDAFYYNAYTAASSQSNSVGTYVQNPATTAIDFTCQNDLAAKNGIEEAADVTKTTICDRGIFYPPVADNATTFANFNVSKGVSQNLLVYTGTDNESNTTEAYDVVHKALDYDESTREYLIKGHHIFKELNSGTSAGSSSSSDFTTDNLHLVERTANGLNSEGETCENNDFCAPIAFTVDKHAWYTRKPQYYAEATEGSWEGICLPFTVDKAVASLNGEITHFYGTPSETEQNDPAKNYHTLHHEYWLRKLNSVTTNTDKTVSAAFERPLPSTSGTTGNDDATGTSETLKYKFSNSFFVDTYSDKLYNKVDNSYYTESHDYNDYLPLTANVPYIVRFPGKRYYEFDLSSAFYNEIMSKNESAQTITFHAYGKEYDGNFDGEKQAIVIPISEAAKMSTTKNSYVHQGIFTAKKVANDVYGMNADGSAFVQEAAASAGSTSAASAQVLPFRTYMSAAAQTSANGRAAKGSNLQSRAASDDGIIRIAEQGNKDEIRPELGVKDSDEASNDYLTVRPIGSHRVSIESTIATELKVYTTTGQLYRILDVQPGTATYSGFNPAIYIFGNVKVMVK